MQFNAIKAMHFFAQSIACALFLCTNNFLLKCIATAGEWYVQRCQVIFVLPKANSAQAQAEAKAEKPDKLNMIGKIKFLAPWIKSHF